MHEMVYFDLSPHRRDPMIPNGTRLPVNAVLHLAAQTEPELWRQCGLPTELGQTGFEPTPQMEGVIQALCVAISGCVASIHDLKNMRRIMYLVPNEYKRSFNHPWEAVAFLAYLLVGFRMHPSDKHKEDSNSVRDAADFAVDLACGRRAHLSSFLCSHRGPSVPGGSWLTESLPEGHVRRALHLQLGLLANAPNLMERSVTWTQQGPSAYASDTIFPELFLRYVHAGRVASMLVSLARHERQLRALLCALNPTTIPVSLEMIDPFLQEVDRFLQERYGTGWRQMDFVHIESRTDALRDMAIEQALSEVNRLLSFRHERASLLDEEEMARLVTMNVASIANIEPEDRLLVPDLARMTTETIWRYQIHQGTHASAKAVFDTAFYYLWGKRCQMKSGQFSIGLDRDHSQHQREAWRLGNGEHTQGRPGHGILYARRSDGTEQPNRFLNTLSFRQFWR